MKSFTSKIAIVAAILLFPAVTNAQWVAPTLTPPNGNASSPVNLSSTGQTKVGGLTLNTGGATYGLLVDKGNVGIGTLTPQFPLSIVTTSPNPFEIQSTNGTGYAQIRLQATGRRYQIGVGDASESGVGVANRFFVFDGTAGAVRMIIDSSGNVGVGLTTALDQKLVVNGNIRVYSGGVSAGYVYSDGSNYGLLNNVGNWAIYVPNGTQNVFAPGSLNSLAFYYTSDRTLKKNIQPLKDSLSKIVKLQGVSFDWKKDGRSDIGVIAQDVEKVFPELVNTDEKTGLKSVEYGNLVAPLIEAIKEQQKQIDSLRLEIDTIKSKK